MQRMVLNYLEYKSRTRQKSQTFPAPTGERETNFIKRCIEQLKQRLYHNQCMEYKATMADFQLIQLDGIQEDECKSNSYTRIVLLI